MESIYTTNISLNTQKCDPSMRTIESIMENGVYKIWKKNLVINTALVPSVENKKKTGLSPTGQCVFYPKVCDMV